jgi:hypothetical protein
MTDSREAAVVLLWLLERLDWTVGFNEDGALRVRIGDPAGHVPHDAILECLARVELDLRVLLARRALDVVRVGQGDSERVV